MIPQAILWCILYPITLLGYFCVTIWQTFWFLFNSPVDIWVMIGETIREEDTEKQQNDTDNQRL